MRPAAKTRSQGIKYHMVSQHKVTATAWGNDRGRVLGGQR
jgi:hypothetical protein